MPEKNQKKSLAKRCAHLLQSSGWQVEIDEQKERTRKVEKDGDFRCIDGRLPIKKDKFKIGVAWPGGVIGVAVMKYGHLDPQKALEKAVADIKTLNLKATIHGDEHHHESGCGFFGLVKKAGFSTIIANWLSWQELAPEEAVGIVKAAGGEYRVLEGEHEEEELVVNLRAGETPKINGRKFTLDLWVAKQLRVSQDEVLKVVSETIHQLKPSVTKAKILI